MEPENLLGTFVQDLVLLDFPDTTYCTLELEEECQDTSQQFLNGIETY